MREDWNNIICIDHWDPDESSYESGLYPEGSREKAVYFSPADVKPLPLKPKWRYLFKKSRAWAPWQFWMEIMAYRIGQIMGVQVPPAYVGLSKKESPGQETYGALIEWFYSEDELYIEGSRLISPLIPGFDHKTGKQHNLRTILNHLLKKPSDSNKIFRKMLEHWAKVLAFDTIIGNTDRHPENWGIIIPRKPSGKTIPVRLSPAFDNGTAMSYEQPEEHFARFDNEQYATRYLTHPQKARHHMRWSLDDCGNMNFFDFMCRFVSEYPKTKASIVRMLQFTYDDLRDCLEPLTDIVIDERSRLTKPRLDFTLKLIMRRTTLLREAMGKI